MRTSRGSGIYPVHESDEILSPDISAASDSGTRMCMTLIKPRLDNNRSYIGGAIF